MKGLIGSGLCLALGLVAAQSFAEEIQFRSAVPTLGVPTPAVAPSAVLTPVNYTFPAGAQTTPTGIGLGRPIAVSGNGQESERPLPFIRAQAPDLPPQALPVGAPLKQDNGKPEPKGAQGPMPQKVKPQPMPLESEFVSPMPRMVPMPKVMQEGPISSSCGCCSMGTTVGSGALMLDGCGVVSMGDCGSGCFNDCCGSCCNDCCATCCDDCCADRGGFWGSASYLLWGFRQKNVPPLVTVSPVGTPRTQSGVLPLNTTAILFDQNNQENAWHSGGRFVLGFWLPCGTWGLEADYFFLGQQNADASFGSSGDPQISRPLVNAVTGLEKAQLVSLPGLVSGVVAVHMDSRMWGLELNARQKLFCGPGYWVDMLYGYRHLNLEEGITIREDLLLDPAAGGLGIVVIDQFHTRNVFNGPQIGVQGEYHFLNRFFAGGTFKLAMGNMRQQVNIAGSTSFTPPGGGTTTFNGGVLAARTNMGNYETDRFAVIPEVGFKIGYDITDHWRVFAGYDFLYVSSVVRPGDQIDRTENGSQRPNVLGPQPLVGPARPAVLFRTTNFWAQGVSFGMEYRW